MSAFHLKRTLATFQDNEHVELKSRGAGGPRPLSNPELLEADGLDAPAAVGVAAEADVAAASAAVPSAGRVEYAVDPDTRPPPLDISDRDDPDIAAVAGIGVGAAAGVAAVVAFRLVHRGPAAAANRVAVAHIVAVADQPIDDVVDDALGLGIALDLSGRRGGREPAGESRGRNPNHNRFHSCPPSNMWSPAERSDRTLIMRQQFHTF